MMGYRQQRPKIGLTVCPDLVDHYILTFWVGSLSQGSRHAESLSYLHLSLPDVVEAALWCFWHGDDLASGEVLLGVLLGRDERVRLVYGLLVGAFYMGEPFRLK